MADSTFVLTKKMKDRSGERFGSLTLTSPCGLNKQGSLVWNYICDCGNTGSITGTAVRQTAKLATNPRVPSCGCEKIKVNKELLTTHNKSSHPLAYIWQAMKQRCYNPNHQEYSRYGGKGVTVCDEWVEDCGAFIDWALANGWEKGMHIDKDITVGYGASNKTYSPDTCIFIPAKENVAFSGSRANWENNKNIKVPPHVIPQIHQAYEELKNQRDVAKVFGISQTTVWKILNNTNRK